MSVIPQLASSLGRRDEVPNQELAQQVASSSNKKAVEELVANLSNKNKDIQSDCIKVLYEVGAVKPSLISPYTSAFVSLLTSKNNRLQWGAMCALSGIASSSPDIIYPLLPQLSTAAANGSVITKDNYVAILISLSTIGKYKSEALALLAEAFQSYPSNQIPMYAENAAPIIDAVHRPVFLNILTARLPDFEKESKRKRVEKVIKKLQKA